MQIYLLNSPEKTAMEAALQAHMLDGVGTTMRLAWQAGMLRNEICDLTWDQVFFWEAYLLVGGRRIPLATELHDYLRQLSQITPPTQTYVVCNGKGKQMVPETISRQVRQALDQEGQTQVRLIDLRHDYILRQLQSQDWQTVSRITGVEALTLQLHFAPHLPQQTVVTKKEKAQGVDTLRLQQVFAQQGTSFVGVALRLAYYAGLNRQELVTLRWKNVSPGEIHINKKTIALEPDLAVFLAQCDQSDPEALVVRGVTSGKAMLADRLSRLCRTALVQGGVDHVSLQDLQLDYKLRAGGEDKVIAYVQTHGTITRKELSQLLGLGDAEAYHRLKQWANKGTLVQVGWRYYLPQTVVAPEKQQAAVVAYLKENQVAYRKDIAALLGISSAQCSLLLKTMVAQGTIIHAQQQYVPKEG